MSRTGYRNVPFVTSLNEVWNVGLLDWVPMTQPSGGGGVVTNDGTFAKETGGNLDAIKADLDEIKVDTDNLSNLDVLLSSRTKPSDQQHVIIDSSASIAVTGPLTDTQLRASAVPISGAISFTAPQHTIVDSGSVTVNNGAGASAVNIQDGGNSITVDGAVTVNTIAGFALEAGHLATIDTSTAGAKTDLDEIALDTDNLALIKAKTDNLDVALSTRAAALTQTDGTQKSIVRGGAKGVTAAADVTSTVQSADRQALDVQLRTSAGAPIDFLQPATVTMSRVNPAWRQAVALLAANAARKEALIVNETNASMFLAESATASDISYVAQVPPRGRYALDGTMAVSGFWNQIPTQGFVVVTERA